MSSQSITQVCNVAPNTRDAYRYHDRHVDDTQSTASFLSVQNGWKASYRQHTDTWHVTTPSGLTRTYDHVK